jgi:hypothetical protein
MLYVHANVVLFLFWKKDTFSLPLFFNVPSASSSSFYKSSAYTSFLSSSGNKNGDD